MPSGSVASPVSPTVVPLEVFSKTVLAAALLSLTAETAPSLTSVKLMVIDWVENEVSAEVARTVMLCEVAAS